MTTYSWGEALDKSITQLLDGDVEEAKRGFLRILGSDSDAPAAIKTEAQMYLRHADKYEWLAGIYAGANSDDIEELRRVQKDIENAMNQKLSFAINKNFVKGQEQRKTLEELFDKISAAIEGKQFNNIFARLNDIDNDLNISAPHEAGISDIRSRISGLESAFGDSSAKMTEAHAAEVRARIDNLKIQTDELQAKLRDTLRLAEQANLALKAKQFDQFEELVKKFNNPEIFANLPEARTIVRQLTAQINLKQSVEMQLRDIAKVADTEPAKAMAQLVPLESRISDLALPGVLAAYTELKKRVEESVEKNRTRALELLKQGQAEIEAKQWNNALKTLYEAQNLSPENQEISASVLLAQRSIEQYQSLSQRFTQAHKSAADNNFSEVDAFTNQELETARSLGLNTQTIHELRLESEKSKRFAQAVIASAKLGLIDETTPLQAEQKLTEIDKRTSDENRALARAEYRAGYVRESTQKLREFVGNVLEKVNHQEFNYAAQACEDSLKQWDRLSTEQTWKEEEKPQTLAARIRIIEQQQKNAFEADKWWQGAHGQLVARANALNGDILTSETGFAALEDLKKSLGSFRELSNGARYMLGEREILASAVNVRKAIREDVERIGSYLTNSLNAGLDTQYEIVQRMLENDQEKEALQICEGLENQARRLSRVFSFIESESPNISKEKKEWDEPLRQTRLRAEKASLGRQKLKEASDLLREAQGEQALSALEIAREGVISLNSKSETSRLEKEANRMREAVRVALDMRSRKSLELELNAVRGVLSLAPGSETFNARSKELERLISEQNAIDREVERQKAMLLQYSDYETTLRWCDQELANPEYSQYPNLRELRAEAARVKASAEQFRIQIATVRELVKKGSITTAIQTADGLLRDEGFKAMPALDRDELANMQQNAKSGEEALRAAKQLLDEVQRLAGNRSNAERATQASEKLDAADERLGIVSACGIGGGEVETQRKRLTLMRGAERGLREADDLLKRSGYEAKYQALRKLSELKSGELNLADRQRVESKYEEVARQVEDIVARGKADAATERDVQEALFGLDALNKLGRSSDEDKMELERRRDICNAEKLVDRAAPADLRRAAEKLSAYMEAGRKGYRIEDTQRKLVFAAAKAEAEELEKSSNKDWGRIAALYQEAHAIRPDLGFNQKASEAQINSNIVSAEAALADLNPRGAETFLQTSFAKTNTSLEMAERAKSLRLAMEGAQAALREPSIDRIGAAMKTLEDRLRQKQLSSTGNEVYGSLKDQAIDKLIALAQVNDEDGEGDEWRIAKVYQAAYAIRPEREDLANKKRTAERQARTKTETLVDDLDKANDNPDLTTMECKKLADRLEKLPAEAFKVSVSLRDARAWLIDRRKQIEKADQLLKQARYEAKNAIGDGKFDKAENILDELCALNDKLFGDRTEVKELRQQLSEQRRRRVLAHATLAEYSQAKIALARQITPAAQTTKSLVDQTVDGSRRAFDVVIQKVRDLKEADPNAEYRTRSLTEGRTDSLDTDITALNNIRAEIEAAKRSLTGIIEIKDAAQRLLDESEQKYDKASSVEDDKSAVAKADEALVKVAEGEKKGDDLASHCATAEQMAHDINMDGIGVAAWMLHVSTKELQNLDKVNEKARTAKSKAEMRVEQTRNDLDTLRRYHDNPKRSYEEALLGISAADSILAKRPGDTNVKTMRGVLDEVEPPSMPFWLKALFITLFIVIISIAGYLLLTEPGQRMLGLKS